MNTADQGQGQSSESIEQRLVSALKLESDQEQPEEALPEGAEQEEAADVIEGEQAEAEEETTEAEETEEADDGQSEEEAEEVAEAEEEAEGIAPDAVVFELTEDGESIPVTAEEARLGYMRTQDYTKKTQQVAAARDEAQQAQRSYGAALSVLAQEANAELQQFSTVNWEHLAMNDPDQYKQAKNAYNQAAMKKQQFDSRTKELMEAVRREEAQQSKHLAQQSLSILKTTVPNWNNQLYADVRDYAVNNLQMSKEEVDNIADWRQILPIYKSMQLDSGQQIATKKKAKPSASKHFKRNVSGGKSQAAMQKNKQAQTRLHKGKTKNERMGGAIDLLAEKFGG